MRISDWSSDVCSSDLFVLTKYLGADPVDYQQTLDEALAFGEYVEPMKSDVAGILHDLRKQGKKVLYEGAQGALLDIDHGTYPYVTSSNTTVGGALAGTGVGADAIDYVLGIAKAYATRVGGGPFPTELHDEVGQGIRDRGQEYGASTGRPRRCGWIALVALQRAVAINGLSALCTNKHEVPHGADAIDYVLGIAKAYATRVGGGPFPTELHDEVGQGIRDRGQEYGASTGRPRRCGWIDIVALKRAVAINGISGLCITKLDVLDGMDKLKMCIAYRYRGKETEYAPLDAQGWDECEPVYLEFPGWSENTHGVTRWDDLPPAARAYLRALEELAGSPISIVSTGPDREHTMVLQDPFA